MTAIAYRMALACVLVAIWFNSTAAYGQGAATVADWQTAVMLKSDSLVIRLRYRPETDPTVVQWIGFELINPTTRPVAVRLIDFWLNAEAYSPDGATPLPVSGVTLDANDSWLFMHPADPRLDRLRGGWVVPPGDTVFCWRLISAGSTADLLRCEYKPFNNCPPCGDRLLRVMARINIDLGPRWAKLRSDTVTIRWHASRETDVPALRVRLDSCLQNFNYSPNTNLLDALLGDPRVHTAHSGDDYAGVLEQCDNSFNEQTLLRFMAATHPGNERLIRFFIGKIDADRIPGWLEYYWSPRYVEPLVRLIERGGDMNAFYVLNRHLDDWLGQPGLKMRLSAAVTRHFSRVLAQADSVDLATGSNWPHPAKLLALSRDSSALPYFRGLLTNKRVFARYNEWDFSNPPPYLPPTRVCDLAFESICLIEGKDVGALYRAASGLSEEALGRLYNNYRDPRSLLNAAGMEMLRDRLIAEYLRR